MEPNSQKWTGQVCAKLAETTADRIWPLFADFFHIHKWFPGLPTSYGIHGTNGEPGCIRYCTGFSLSSRGSSQNSTVNWAKERLTAIDHVNHSLTYEIVDCNIGINSYQPTIKIVPESLNGKDGCLIEWIFTVDPLEGWLLEDLVATYEEALNLMAKKMEDQIANSADNYCSCL